ncbi:MAG: N-6 DNA methylase, partial [Ktedonobacteraceae bacterium]
MAKKQHLPTQPDLLSQVPNTSTYHNQRLFSDHFLENILPKDPAWLALRAEAAPVMAALKQRFSRFPTPLPFANEAQTEEDWVRPVLSALGHAYEVQTQLRMPGAASPQHPDYVLYASDEQKLANRGQEITDLVAQRGAIAVGDAKQWDVPLDQMRKGASDSFSNKNPSFQIFFYMLHTKLPWGILTNGRKWRLYHEDTAYKLEVYYEVDLPDLLISEQSETFTEQELDRFLYFYAFFRRAAFESTQDLSLAYLLRASAHSSQKIRENLREQVYRALEYVAQGFLAYPANALTPTPAICQQVYESSLILLYRLLFILYAESRALLPVENKAYGERYSLRIIKEQIRQTLAKGEVLLPDSGVIWAQLNILFSSINQGNKRLGISTFNGGLFDTRKHGFLEHNIVGDLSLADAIDQLARAPEGEKDFSEKTVIDYRDLSERHLGTIYEGLLEYTLHMASETLAELRSTSKVVPVAEASPKDIARIYQPGDVYLVTDAGERKTSGSYYTPDYIVKYMVEQTLLPVLKQATEGHEQDSERIAAILAINVLDPAMGSGHFPVEVVEYIARYLVELGVQPEGKSESEADMTYWKRRVAQHCIYGVDFNPLAVELAKLSLWLATAAKGYPLNFLDHHLRPGNALIGAWLAEVATEHPKEKLARMRQAVFADQAKEQAEDTSVQPFSLWEDQVFTQSLSGALDIVHAIEQMPGNTIAEVKQQEAAYAELRTLFVNKYRDVMHLGVAQFYDLKIDPKLWGAYAAYSIKTTEEQQKLMGAEKGYLPTIQQARAMGDVQRLFHWELEFPELFFEPDGRPRGEQAGFDAIVGNPPYVRQEKLSADKPFYQEHHEMYHGSADLFVYFFAQGLRLLRPGGRLAYISSNSWLRANYATPLRRY